MIDSLIDLKIRGYECNLNEKSDIYLTIYDCLSMMINVCDNFSTFKQGSTIETLEYILYDISLSRSIISLFEQKITTLLKTPVKVKIEIARNYETFGILIMVQLKIEQSVIDNYVEEFNVNS